VGAKNVAQKLVTPSRWLAMFAAIVLLTFFLAGCVLLYLRAGDAAEDDWSKYIKIFEALGPLVGLAVGWIFGKEVHRREAENATSRAKEAKRAADSGIELAGVIRGLKTHPDKSYGAAGEANAVDSAGRAVAFLESAVAEANRLFPASRDDSADSSPSN
jgi:hypothetical protein